MPNPSDTRTLDERLAQYADRLLAGETLAPDSDPELRDLQETLQTLHGIAREKVDPALRGNLQRTLQAEWRKREETRRITHGIDYMRLGLVMTALAVMIAAALLLPGLGGPLTGAAGANSALVPGLGLAVLFLIAGIYWIIRRRK